MKPSQTSSETTSAQGLFERLAFVDNPPSEHDFNAIIEHQDAVIPLLLKEVEKFAASPYTIEAYGKGYIRHVVAIFLLAHLRNQDVYPSLITLISRQGDQVVTLTGEVFTEALARILASVCDGDLAPIKKVVENEKLNPWIRAGALESLMVLWKEGVLPRSEVVSYLSELLQGKLESQASYVWDAIALIAHDIHPLELEAPLRSAIAAKLIEPVVMDAGILDRCLQEPFIAANKTKEQLVDGFIKQPSEELSWWLYPSNTPLQKGAGYDTLEVPIVDKEVLPGERVSPMGWRSATVVRGGAKLGRNEPCLCGSGKKYKKCCLKH